MPCRHLTTSTVLEAADCILSALSSLNRPISRLLRKGLPADQLERLQGTLGWRLPAEAIELYGWRNGVREDPKVVLDDIYFFPGYCLLSFQDALDFRRTYRDAGLWPDRWFPVFHSGGGDFKVLDCGRSSDASVPVVSVIKGEQPFDEYSSLSSMMTSLADGFAERAFYISREGFLEVDDQRYAAIAHRHNPNIDAWRDFGS